MMRYCRYLLLPIVSILAAAAVFAQQPRGGASAVRSAMAPKKQQSIDFDNPSEAERMLERFDGRFAFMDSIVFYQPLYLLSEPEIDSAGIDFVVSRRVEEIDRAVDAQVLAMKSRTGLEIRGQAYVRPGRFVSYDPDDPLVAYNAKLQAELVWDIFHSSLYKRASKIRELRLQGDIRQLEYEKDALRETIYLQRQTVRYRYFGRLLTILNIHAANLALLMDTQTYLLKNGKISSDDLMKLISEQAEIERQLIAIKSDSIVNELPARASVSCITVADTAVLMNYIREEHHDLKKLTLRQELLKVQRKNIDYLQSMEIQPFARIGYYNRASAHNTHNIDVGLTFRIPISLETARRRKALRAEQSVVGYELQQTGQEIEREVLMILRDLDNYNENIYGEYRRMSSLKEYLKMRINSYSNVAGEYSRIDRLQEYNAYLQAWERMLNYAYQRDCKLIELQSYVLDEPISKFLAFNELRQF